MFEQILQAVKEHISNDPQLSAAIPDEHKDAVAETLATHVHEAVQGQAPAAEQPAGSGLLGGLGGIGGGFLSNIEQSLSSGGVGTNALTGGIVGALTGKLGLSPAITGAIAAAIPGILQKVMHRNNPAS